MPTPSSPAAKPTSAAPADRPVLRARFLCATINPSTMVTMYAVPDNEGIDEARRFGSVPNGKLELTISSTKTLEFFKPGRSYYLDLTEVP